MPFLELEAFKDMVQIIGLTLVCQKHLEKSQAGLCKAILKCDLGRTHPPDSSRNTVWVETSVSGFASVLQCCCTSQVPSCHMLGLATCTCSFMPWRQHASRLRIRSYNIKDTPKCEYTEEKPRCRATGAPKGIQRRHKPNCKAVWMQMGNLPSAMWTWPGGQGSHSFNHVDVTSPYSLDGNELLVSGLQLYSQPEDTFEVYSLVSTKTLKNSAGARSTTIES